MCGGGFRRTVVVSAPTKERTMNGFHPSLTASLAAEHHRDLLRAARNARLVADLTDVADRNRLRTPAQRPAWWARVTAPMTFLRTSSASA